MQTQGYNLSTKFYEAEIGQQQKIVDNLSQKYIAMKRNFAQAVQDGKIKEGTEEYYEMQNEIDQVAISLKEAQNKVVEFQASIRDLKWEQFDQLQDAIGRITSESDFLIDLMSHKDMYDKDGKMTEQGLATMGLHGVNYNTYMAQADKYKEEMLKISAELANDPNNQKLIDRKNEESNVNIASVFDNVTFNLPNVIDSQAFVRELVTNKKAERAIQAMTIDRIRGGSSLAKYKYKH